MKGCALAWGIPLVMCGQVMVVAMATAPGMMQVPASGAGAMTHHAGVRLTGCWGRGHFNEVDVLEP